MGSVGLEQGRREPTIDHNRLHDACDLRASAGVTARSTSRQSINSGHVAQPDLQSGLVDVCQKLLSEIRAERTELVELLGRTARSADEVFKACLFPDATALDSSPPPASRFSNSTVLADRPDAAAPPLVSRFSHATAFSATAAFNLQPHSGDLEQIARNGDLEQSTKIKQVSRHAGDEETPAQEPCGHMSEDLDVMMTLDSTMASVAVDFEEVRAQIADDADDEEEKVRKAEILKLLSFLPDCWLIRCLGRGVDWFYNLEEPERVGCLARFVLHSRLEIACISVIMTNVLFAAYQVDSEIANLGKHPSQLIVCVELAFLTFYIVELILKMSVHKAYYFVNDNWKWNIFDLFLVFAGAYDQAALHIFPELNSGSNLTFMRMFRLMKLSKIMRVFRVIHFLHELRLMLLSMYKSLVSLFWCVVLLSIILYVFSLFIVMGITNALAAERDDISTMRFDDIMDRFGSMSRTIISLFKAATGGADWGEYYEAIEIAGPQYMMLFLFYIAFFTFAVMNILTGMIVDNVVKESRADDDDRLLQYRRDQAAVLLDATRVFESLDENGDGMVGESEFMKGMKSDELVAMLQAIDIEVHDIEWFFKMLLYIEGSDRINIRNFMDACQKMKGHATSVDVQYLAFETKCIRKSLAALSERLRVRGI